MRNHSIESRKRRSQMAKRNGYGKWMLGKKHSEETKNKIRSSLLGKNIKVNAGVKSIHIWIRNRKRKINKCELCGDTTRKVYDFANKDHKYSRDINDYMELCRSCHRKYDIANNNYITSFMR